MTAPKTSDALLATFGSQWVQLPLSEAFTSFPNQRARSRLDSILDWFNVEDSPRYRPLGGTTYCNIFVWDVTRALTAEIPHWVDADWLPCGQKHPGARETTANMLFGKLRDGAWGWRECDQVHAGSFVRGGFPVVAAWKNPKGPGHIAMLTPSDDDILVAQAGAVCARRIPIQHAFGAGRMPDVRYFWHD